MTVASEYVDRAERLTRAMVERETRGSGDTEAAMRRIEMKYGVSYSDLWALRYRKPKRIWADVLERIRAAYEAQRQEQMRRLQHDIEITKAISGADCAAVRAAEALVDKDTE